MFLSSHIQLIRGGVQERIPQECPSSTFLNLIEQCWSRDPEARPDPTDVLQTLTTQVASELGVSPLHARICQQEHFLSTVCPRNKVDTYLAPEVGTSGSDVQTALNAFLCESNTRCCVLFGTGGLGKSMSAYVLCIQLLNDLRLGKDAYFPVFLRPAADRWAHSNLHGLAAKAMGMLRCADLEHVQESKLLFVLDGFDELEGDHGNNLLEQLGVDKYPNSKLLVSCRPGVVENLVEVFGSNHVDHTLKPFKDQQIIQYLQKTVDAREKFHEILELSALRSALETPFVLFLFSQSWSRQKQHLRALKHRGQIYKAFVEHWVLEMDLPQEVLETLGKSFEDRVVTMEDLFKRAAVAMADGRQILRLTEKEI